MALTAAATLLVARMTAAPMTASGLVGMLAAPGYAGVAVGHKIVDVFAVVRDGVQQASHGLHGRYSSVDLAYRQIHWGLAVPDWFVDVPDSLVDAVGDRDSSWGVVPYSSSLDENQSGVVEYAVDDGMEHRSKRGETRWRVSGSSNWVGSASARGRHDVPVVLDLRGVVCRHRRRRRLYCYGR